MSPLEFVYWLQGHFELELKCGKPHLSGNQVEIIKEHIALVLKKETSLDPSTSTSTDPGTVFYNFLHYGSC